jgi:hypothetical protein
VNRETSILALLLGVGGIKRACWHRFPFALRFLVSFGGGNCIVFALRLLVSLGEEKCVNLQKFIVSDANLRQLFVNPRNFM